MRSVIKTVLLTLIGSIVILLGFFAGGFLGVTILDNWALSVNLFLTAILCIYVGITEEVLFRFALMDHFLERKLKWSPIKAVIVSSLIFGAMHIFNQDFPLALPQAIGAALGGLSFAYFYKRYGLLSSIILHATYDFLIMSGILQWVITSLLHAQW
jgi:membrane protease YdiL (CAAX protease family)